MFSIDYFGEASATPLAVMSSVVRVTARASHHR